MSYGAEEEQKLLITDLSKIINKSPMLEGESKSEQCMPTSISSHNASRPSRYYPKSSLCNNTPYTGVRGGPGQ